MTYEVALKSRLAVTLAASTLTYIEDGNRKRLYFKGANRIFSLFQRHPVGIIGSARAIFTSMQPRRHGLRIIAEKKIDCW